MEQTKPGGGSSVVLLETRIGFSPLTATLVRRRLVLFSPPSLGLAGCLLIGLILGLAPRAAAQEINLQPFRPQEEISPSEGAAKAFSSFQRAWSSGNAGRIAQLIPEDGRASVTIESRGVSSPMSRGQIEALLDGVFSEAERAAFDLSTIHLSNETSAYAVGDWIYEAGASSGRRRQTVFVVFRQALPGVWLLSELRIQQAN